MAGVLQSSLPSSPPKSPHCGCGTHAQTTNYETAPSPWAETAWVFETLGRGGVSGPALVRAGLPGAHHRSWNLTLRGGFGGEGKGGRASTRVSQELSYWLWAYWKAPSAWACAGHVDRKAALKSPSCSYSCHHLYWEVGIDNHELWAGDSGCICCACSSILGASSKEAINQNALRKACVIFLHFADFFLFRAKAGLWYCRLCGSRVSIVSLEIRVRSAMFG